MQRKLPISVLTFARRMEEIGHLGRSRLSVQAHTLHAYAMSDFETCCGVDHLFWNELWSLLGFLYFNIHV